MAAQDPSEQFVYDICSKSFFALWSYLNPLREDGKELCDILVQFGRSLIIISVKDINYDETSDDRNIAIKRWTKRAVEKSVKAVLGAERYLRKRGSFTGRRTPITGQLLGLNKVWLDGLSGPRDPSQVSRGR